MKKVIKYSPVVAVLRVAIRLFTFLLLIGALLVIASSCSEGDKDNLNINQTPVTSIGTFTDPRDGEVYETVIIDNQEWMAKNLAYAPSSGNYWAYDNNNAYVETYGYLYDWQTALNACPTGWHLPSYEDWKQLVDNLGGQNVAGGKLKATGTIEAGTGLWLHPNFRATNEIGFAALPGGNRNFYEAFNYIGGYGNFWSSSEYDTDLAYFQFLSHFYGYVHTYGLPKQLGFSVRCIKD